MRVMLLLVALIGASTVCADDLDVLFIADGSRSVCGDDPVPCPNWKAVLQFFSNITDTWEIGPDDKKVAFVTFGKDVKVEWNLDRYPNKTELLTAIDRVPYPGGDMIEASLVRVIVTEIFNKTAGDRPDARNVVMLITDGSKYINSTDAEAASNALQAKGIDVIVVCIQTGCTEDFAKSLSSPPKEMTNDQA